MLNKILLGTAALAFVAGVAYADTTPTPPPPAPDQNQTAQPDAQGQWTRGWFRHGHRHMGMQGEMRGGMNHWQDQGPMAGGAPGMVGGRMGMTGFRLQLGNGINVGLMCGQQSLKDCIADAQPLIDAAKSAAAAQPAKAQ